MAGDLVEKLRTYGPLSASDEAMLQDVLAGERAFAKGEDMVVEGSSPTYSSLLLSGMAARYSMTSEGKRQITSIHISGDFVDLHSFVLKAMDHAITALTPCRIAQAPHAALDKVVRSNPHLTKLLWMNTLVDGAAHRAWLVAMGRLSSRQHMANLMCELYVRYCAIGGNDGPSFRLPISQAELGDVLGLSIVHVNRVLQELRGRNLIAWEKDVVTIKDLAGLQAEGDFDPTYLQSMIGETRSLEEMVCKP